MKLLINNLLLGACMIMAVSSCVKEDNFDGPNASFEGSLVQDGKGANIQTCTGNVSIRLEQLNWNETPAPQDIPIKMDGTFKNSKLFKGHYRVSVKGGAFWAVPPVEIDIDKGSRYDFTLVPYLMVNNFTQELTGTTLKLNFNLEAPIEGTPSVIDIQPYVNTTEMVGPGASIFEFSDLNKTPINKEWANMTDAEKSPEITIPNLIPGRIFYVRVGVRFNDNDKSSNLSEIIRIEVPKP
jgi:hypothetical protein